MKSNEMGTNNVRCVTNTLRKVTLTKVNRNDSHIINIVIEDHMLDWHSCQICYPLKINLLIHVLLLSSLLL